jgi:hypothetical protein
MQLPLSPITDEHQAALHQLATIFSSVAPSPPPAPRVEHAMPPLPAVPRVDTDSFTCIGKTRNRAKVRRAEKSALKKSQSSSKKHVRFASTNSFDSLNDVPTSSTCPTPVSNVPPVPAPVVPSTAVPPVLTPVVPSTRLARSNPTDENPKMTLPTGSSLEAVSGQASLPPSVRLPRP